MKLKRAEREPIDYEKAREAIMDELRKSPMHLSELARRIGVSISACKTLVNRMVGAGEIKEERMGGLLILRIVEKIHKSAGVS